MSIIKPFDIYLVVIKASFNMLKPNYLFCFDEKGINRKHDNQAGYLGRKRFRNISESDHLILIEYTKKEEDLPSHILIPKKHLNFDHL